MRKKLLLTLMTLTITSATVMGTSMPAFAFEDNGLDGIINDMFGQDKPQPSEDADFSYNNNGAIYLAPGEEPNWGPSSVETSAPASEPEPEQTTSSSDNSSQDTPEPSRSEDTSSDHGSDDSGSSAAQDTPSYTAPAANTNSSQPANTQKPAAKKAAKKKAPKAPKKMSATPITDAAILAELPSALTVTMPDGATYIHSLDKNSISYTVWFNGTAADIFWIADNKNAVVPMTKAEIVTSGEKHYVNVTIDSKVKGATVQASPLQKAAWVKLFGINGVMINGTLADTFVDDPALWN